MYAVLQAPRRPLSLGATSAPGGPGVDVALAVGLVAVIGAIFWAYQKPEPRGAR